MVLREILVLIPLAITSGSIQPWILFWIVPWSNDENQLGDGREENVKRIPACVNRGETMVDVRTPLYSLAHLLL